MTSFKYTLFTLATFTSRLLLRNFVDLLVDKTIKDTFENGIIAYLDTCMSSGFTTVDKKATLLLEKSIYVKKLTGLHRRQRASTGSRP